MSTPQFILALDQGTTSSRAILFDRAGSPVAVAQREFPQIYPAPGNVEHDPEVIWSSQLAVAQEVLKRGNISASQIAAIGIANQRETTVVWERATGRAVANAIVWQSRVSTYICEQMKAAGLERPFRERTGLVLDPYFSGTKLKHLLDTVPNLRQRAASGEVLFGTVDSYLLWRLTGAKRHATDATNASRTLLFNIHTMRWDDELLATLEIPRAMLPEVCSSSEVYAHTDPALFGREIPIAGIAGDQQAALFGQQCFVSGTAKATYGTGCFVLLNTGSTPAASKSGQLTTVAWKLGDEVTYALEGAVFIAGAVVQWLRDGLRVITQSADIEALANTVPDCGGVYFVPAFVGLGAPYWDPLARGTIIGLTRETTVAHIAHAALDSIAFQTRDVLDLMQTEAGISLSDLRVDGGASRNNRLLQSQADSLNVNVLRPVVTETTALGAAYLAGLAVGYWRDRAELQQNWQLDREFRPEIDPATREASYRNWRRAVERSRDWA